MADFRIDARLSVASACASILMMSAHSAFAADAPDAAAAAPSDELQEVVVTAERHQEDLQKTALTVTVISADKVEKTGITTFDKLLEDVPGVQVQAPQGPAAIIPYIAIRGLGTDGDNKPGATAVYLDGMLTSALGGELYDLSRVEILRGPQGTLYGGSATGGALNLYTNAPSLKDYEASALVEAADYGLLHSVAVVNAPLSDSFAIRAAANVTRRNSYADSSNTLNSTTNARVKLLFAPNDAINVIVGAEFFNLSGVTTDGYKSVNGSGHPIGAYYGVTGFGSYQGYRFFDNMTFDFGFARLTNITSVEKTHDDPSTFSQPQGAGFTSQPHKDQTTEELRLASEDGSFVTWTVGLWDKYYYQNDAVNIAFGDDALPIQPSAVDITVPETNQWQEYAAFGQATVPVTSSTRLTGGLRASRDQVDFVQNFTWTGNGPPFLNCGPPSTTLPCTVQTIYNHNGARLDYLGRLEQDLGANNLLYAMASSGYRPGGDSAPKTAYAQPTATYNTEVVHAYEIGSKNRFLDNKLQLNGDVYLNRYPAFQNEITNIGGPGGQAHIPSIVGIAAQFYGAELEAEAALSSADRLSLSGSFIHANYTQNGSWTNPFGGPTLNLPTDGRAVPHAPQLQLNADYTRTQPLANGSNLVLDGNVHFQTQNAVSFDPCLYNPIACTSDGSTRDGLEQKPYTIFNVSVSYNSPGDKYSATLYCKNCGNDQIKVFSAGGGYYTLAPPFTFGLLMSIKL